MRLRTRASAALAAVLVASAVALPATADPVVDLLAVSVVGDGSSSGNVAVPVAIQLLDGDGQLGASIPLPTVADGDQHALTLGADRDQQGALQQSADHRYVTIGGYDAEPGPTSLNDTTAPEVLRVVGRIAEDGVVDTSTSLADAYSVRHIRGVTTSDGEQLWTGGHGHDAPSTQGGVLAIPLGGDTPVPVTVGDANLNNTRVPVLHDGQLYVSSDRTGFHGVNRVGDGLPTDEATMTLVAPAPAGSSIPHDFTFVGDDLLYVTYTDGAAGIAKYVLDEGTWTHVGTTPGAYWGVTGRVAGDDVVLYTVRGAAQGNQVVRLVDVGGDDAIDAIERTLATAASGTAFRGIDFAPGFVPGTEPVDTGELDPTLQWDVRVAGGAGNALSAVLGAPTNPTARGQITDPVGDGYLVTVASSDPAVVADDAIDLQVDDTGRFTLTATPSGTGKAVLTVTVTTEAGASVDAPLDYWVSAPLADPTALAHVGMSDASAAEDAGDGHFFVADDDSNAIRLFGPTFGEPVADFDFSDHLPAEREGEAYDLEASARIGGVVYWVGSLGNTRSGNVRLDRDVVLATTVHGTGADATLAFAGYAKGLRAALVDWDAADGHGLGADHLGFTAATQPGVSAEGPNALNVEGAAIAPDGTTLWLGFRSPLVPIPDGGHALLVGVEDIAAVVAGDAEPTIGEVITLDLGGRAIRDLVRTDDGRYLIVAGSADDEGNFALFGWSGEVDDAPVPDLGTLGLDGWQGSYEAVPRVTSLADGTVVRVLQDAGTVVIYGDGIEAQDLPAPELKKFVAHDHVLDFGAVFVPKSLTLTLDTIEAGGTLELVASGFAPGEPVVVELRSDPVELLATTADGDGTVVAEVTIPDDTPAGTHLLVVVGASGEVSVPVMVLAASVTDEDDEDDDTSNGTTDDDATGGTQDEDDQDDDGTGGTGGTGGALASTGAPALPLLVLASLLALAGGLLLVRRGDGLDGVALASTDERVLLGVSPALPRARHDDVQQWLFGDA